MDRLTKQIIKCKVMQYPNMRNKINDDIFDIAEKGASNSVLGGRCSARNVSGFDEKLARIMSREDYFWCEAIKSAVGYFKERGQDEVIKVVDELYWKSKLNADGVARILFISRRLVYSYVDRFFEILHKFAIKNGVANIE